MRRKNAWEVVGKDLGFRISEAAKHALISHQNMRQKKTLKDPKRSSIDAEKLMKAEKDMEEYLFLSWLDNFVYERKV